MNRFQSYILRLFLTLTAAVAAWLPARALPLATYAEQSVLATGSWYKVSVKETGLHFISNATLRRMGLKDPSSVKVYGYGAMRLPDRLDNSYIDDLPQVQTVTSSDGIYFYATGPVTIVQTAAGLRQKFNPFTTEGYYYLTEGDGESRRPRAQSSRLDMPAATMFTDIVYHERDLYNAGETGHEMLGEDFLTVDSQSFDLRLTNPASTEARIECAFYAKSKSNSRITLSVNGKALVYSTSDQIKGTSDRYTHYNYCLTEKNLTLEPGVTQLKVNVAHTRPTQPSLSRLGHITIRYDREMRLTDGLLDFHLQDKGGRIAGATADTRLWDVTDPLDIIAIDLGSDGGWQPAAGGLRHYVAWNPGAKAPAPEPAGAVDNQNLHGEPTPDMVIFTHSDWRSEAERVANLHRLGEDSLRVLIVDQNDLYNEFSSGSPDANALRKLLKMFWDRSSTPADGHHLRYALIMGRSIYDNRRLMTTSAALPYPTLPGWQTDSGLSDNTSYTTDDIYALLSDNSGNMLEAEYQCIGVGRMPVAGLSDARNVVDKLVAYVTTPINTTWKNRVIMVADDGNAGKFLLHCDAQVARAMATPGGRRALFQKVYLDAYERRNSTYPGARNDMFRMLSEGAVWWNFAGHANPSSWTGDGLMTYADINNLYIKHYPFTVAATCDFLRWDSRTISAAEILYRTPGSGIIGAISATRPALIDRNGELLAALGDHQFALDADGRNLPIGEIYRRLKNNSAGDGIWLDSNKLRYVLMGDPAMRLCIPNRQVVLDGIDGIAPELDNQATMMARQEVTLTGHVAAPDGTLLDDFDGTVSLTLYDAEYSTTSYGHGDDGAPQTFERHGNRLQIANDSVIGGRFTAKMVMPSEIAGNFRPATLNMYAVAGDGRDAVGINREFYVFGVDENALPDDTPPVIEAFYLNHSSFAPGQSVNSTPVVIARITDDRSINISTAGIGHQMLLTIDGRSLTDVPQYYTPLSDGTPGGTIVYQLDELTMGDHSLRLRVWDTSGNSTSETIDFNVGHDVAPTLYDLYADANPASTSTNFYLTHDRPDAVITVQVEVFSMLGRPVWSTTVKGMSDTLRSFPVNWDLTDQSGRRVIRGIYLYRASVTDADGLTSTTETRRIAVTGK